MQRWTPTPISRVVLIFINTPLYFAIIAGVASIFWVVDKAALLPISVMAIMISLMAATRVFVEITDINLSIGSYHPLLPRISRFPISTITSVKIIPQGSPFSPHFLEIIQPNKKQKFALGWFSPSTAEKIVTSLEDMLRE